VSVSWHSVGFFGLGTGDYRYAGLDERDEHDRWEAASAAGPEVRRSNGPRNAVVLIIRHAEDANSGKGLSPLGTTRAQEFHDRT
jgi:hypothetical protein